MFTFEPIDRDPNPPEPRGDECYYCGGVFERDYEGDLHPDLAQVLHVSKVGDKPQIKRINVCKDCREKFNIKTEE